ncbi:MAG TPA: HD domain-containing phosphohydrolase [Nitrospiria bacterium]|nr:HD domain-containing phosphohydrolase [Nitrospiria bacterium]
MHQKTEKILIVDDEPNIRTILSRHLSKIGYSCTVAENSQSAIGVLETDPHALVITDIRMPGRDGVWLLEALKAKWPDTAVLMITALDDSQIAINCLKLGAYDYLIKPLHLEEVTLATQSALEKRRLVIENKHYQEELEARVVERTSRLQETLAELELNYDHTLEALVAALDAREHETGNHSKRVAQYTLLLSEPFDISKSDRLDIYRGAFLHDIGKIGVSDNILLKPGKLTAEEWTEMQRHPSIGYNILKQIGFLEGATRTVVSHHERFDGKGYPKGLRGDEIPLGARIFSVADAFDTMTTDRPYRKALTYPASRDEILHCSGSQFDPKVVEVFLKISQRDWLDCQRAGRDPHSKK